MSVARGRLTYLNGAARSRRCPCVTAPWEALSSLSPACPSQLRNKVRPYGHGSDEQHQRGQCGGFFKEHLQHGRLLDPRKRPESLVRTYEDHCSISVLSSCRTDSCANNHPYRCFFGRVQAVIVPVAPKCIDRT